MSAAATRSPVKKVQGVGTHRYVGAYGCRYDADTGLTYMRQRWYSQGLQRFISRDKVRGSNRYAYANNNPLTYIDPTGLQTTIEHYYAIARQRVGTQDHPGLDYWGGAGVTGSGCFQDTMGGQLGVPENSIQFGQLPDSYNQVSTPKIGDIAKFDAHWGTVVDFTPDGRPIIYGRDGNYGVYSGTPQDWSSAYALQGYYRDPNADPAANTQVREYRANQAQNPNGLHLPTDNTQPDNRGIRY
jgi:RHS repeat-associated protein